MNKTALQVIELINDQRQKEIADEINLSTTFPLYVVYEDITHVSPDSSYTQSTSMFSDKVDGIAIAKDLDPEGESDDEQELTIGYHDRFVTCCFTRTAADDFIKNERHNLTNPRVWVDHIPHRNIEMRTLCVLFGDKA